MRLGTPFSLAGGTGGAENTAGINHVATNLPASSTAANGDQMGTTRPAVTNSLNAGTGTNTVLGRTAEASTSQTTGSPSMPTRANVFSLEKGNRGQGCRRRVILAEMTLIVFGSFSPLGRRLFGSIA
jgi:hypothetical protein